MPVPILDWNEDCLALLRILVQYVLYIDQLDRLIIRIAANPVGATTTEWVSVTRHSTQKAGSRGGRC
jgi:hypothetical protein